MIFFVADIGAEQAILDVLTFKNERTVGYIHTSTLNEAANKVRVCNHIAIDNTL